MVELDNEQWYYATDTVRTSFEHTEGVSTDDDGSPTFEWDVVPTVDADQIPSYYQQFFDDDEFLKLTATAARPIQQQYVVGDEEYTFKKPADELKKSAWSLDNKPWTLNHPETGTVKSVDQIHGFWKNPRFDGEDKDLDVDLYFPANDEAAREYIANHTDVSVGFYNRLSSADEDGVDAYQTDIYYDHLASVPRGRCPGEKGCGLDTDHAHALTTEMMPPTDGSHGADLGDSAEVNTTTETMTDSSDSCTCGDNDGSILDVEDMAVDAIRTRNDAVEETFDEYESKIADLEGAAEALDTLKEESEEYLDVDEGDDVITTVVDALSEYEELRAKEDERRTQRREELIGDITEHADYEAEDLTEMSLDDIESKHDALDKAGVFEEDEEPETSPTTANADNEGDESSEPSFDEDSLYTPQY